MTQQHEPAVHKVPLEIWWKIVDEAIDQHNPFFYSTTFEGSKWSVYSITSFFQHENYLQKRAEAQRKIISSVCRSWQAFARSRRDLCVTLKLDGTSNILQKLEGALNARRGELHSGVCQQIILSPHCKTGFNWEIVEMNRDIVDSFISIPFPHMRRLRMNPWGGFDPTGLLNALTKFNDITWLDYEARHDIFREYLVVDKNRSPVIVPHLQVLCYQFHGPFQFPFRHLVLPSLRYLSFHIDEWPTDISLTYVLSRFCRTLRSCTINMRVLTGDYLNPLSIKFPPWDEFPKLVELFFEGPWIIKFHPLPPEHPLQSLKAQHDSFDAIPSLFRGENMKEVWLQGVTRADDGSLKGRNGGVIMDKVGVDRLLERAEGREISLKVAWNEIVFRLD
ncbi:hypothetical protein CPB86DRAFT_784852 [Serendipita vermifera]|nr:hypothetical protein CPB86DRAFT_784852 [Serendipita vermifera]